MGKNKQKTFRQERLIASVISTMVFTAVLLPVFAPTKELSAARSSQSGAAPATHAHAFPNSLNCVTQTQWQ
jgi:hypothetical protein